MPVVGLLENSSPMPSPGEVPIWLSPIGTRRTYTAAADWGRGAVVIPGTIPALPGDARAAVEV